MTTDTVPAPAHSAEPESLGQRVFVPMRGVYFILTTWDTGRTDERGRTFIRYRLDQNARNEWSTVFEGEDFACSPLHAIDSDATFRSLMTFLTLRPGDTDAEYFDGYTDAQRAFADTYAEALSAEVALSLGDES
jgi:hypothetical protein